LADFGICIGVIGEKNKANILYERNVANNSAIHIINKGNVVQGSLNLSNQIEGESIISFPSVNTSGYLFITRHLSDSLGRGIPFVIAITTSLKNQVMLYKNINELKLITKTIKASLLKLHNPREGEEKIKVIVKNLMNSTYTESWMNQIFGTNIKIQQKATMKKKKQIQEKSRNIAQLQHLIKKNLDQVVYSLVVGNPVVIIGKNAEILKFIVETLSLFTPHRNLRINDVIGFFPKPMSSESYDLIGIYPEYKPKKRKDQVTVDLEKSKVQGGKKNKYCESLLKELEGAEKKSEKLFTLLIERRINWLLMSAASLTQVEDLNKQKIAINDLMKKLDRDSIYLIGKILEQKNSLVYKQILNRFSLKSRLFKALF
jgi:hypothetical protein